jgi:hypothetical protein
MYDDIDALPPSKRVRAYEAIWGERSEFPVYLGAASIVLVMFAIGLAALGH